MRLPSIESSFHPCNICRDSTCRGVPRGGQNVCTRKSAEGKDITGVTLVRGNRTLRHQDISAPNYGAELSGHFSTTICTCARNAIKLRKQKHCVRCFTQRTQAPANRNGRSKQLIIEAANQALAFLAVFVYATRATQAIALRACVRALRLNGNRA